jgi:hypothetical protein
MNMIFDFNSVLLVAALAAMLVVSALDTVQKRRRFLLNGGRG